MLRSLSMDRKLLGVQTAASGNAADGRQHGVGARAEMVDQDGVRLAEMTADDREELARRWSQPARWRSASITRSAGTGSPRWIVKRHARAGRDQAGDDDGAGRCREPEQARGHVEREALPLHANMPVVPAFRRDHQDPSRPQMFVDRAQLGPIEDAASIRAPGHCAEPVDVTPVEWARRGEVVPKPRRRQPPRTQPVAQQDRRPEMQGGQDDRPAEGMVPFHSLQTGTAATVLPSPPREPIRPEIQELRQDHVRPLSPEAGDPSETVRAMAVATPASGRTGGPLLRRPATPKQPGSPPSASTRSRGRRPAAIARAIACIARRRGCSCSRIGAPQIVVISGRRGRGEGIRSRDHRRQSIASTYHYAAISPAAWPQSAQFSNINPGTSDKSQMFRVIGITFAARAILAIDTSPRAIRLSF